MLTTLDVMGRSAFRPVALPSLPLGAGRLIGPVTLFPSSCDER